MKKNVSITQKFKGIPGKNKKKKENRSTAVFMVLTEAAASNLDAVYVLPTILIY
jgi:hypothetical protein